MYCAASCSSIFDARGIEQVAEKPDRRDDDTDPPHRATPTSHLDDEETGGGGRGPRSGPRGHPRLGNPGRSRHRGPLTSDLVTHAVIGWDSATITLAVRCSHDQLRVDVYDTSLPLPMAVD